MEKTNRELLIKEISTRLPYGVKAKVYGWDEEKGEVEVHLKIYSINTDGYVQFEANDYDVDYIDIDDCLLYLRLMSSMTEEEREEYKDLLYVSKFANDLVLGAKELIDWLNAHHFDYRGLIEKGLALEAPEGMYKF